MRNQPAQHPHFIAAKQWVKLLLERQLDANLVYHNWQHTESVVRFTDTIAHASNCSLIDHTALLWAALFHDTGFLKHYDGHEAQSITIFLDYRNSYPMPADSILVVQLILATRISAQPESILESIIKDADLNNLGQSDYLTTVKNLWSEWRIYRAMNAPAAQLLEENLHFLNSHKYFTEAGNSLFLQQKQNNILLVEEALAAL